MGCSWQEAVFAVGGFAKMEGLCLLHVRTLRTYQEESVS